MNFKKEVPDQDKPHLIKEFTDKDGYLYEKFINEYDESKSRRFPGVSYRKGAVITGSFGLEEGFKKNSKGEMEWGYVRDHTGVDRANGGSEKYSWGTVEDVVICPFNFDRSSIVDFGDTSYGTLISLFNEEYQFEFRIAHMNPNQKVRKGKEKGPIVDWSLDRLKKRKSFEKGWCLGSAGTYGDSTGPHTHTEIKSIDESCEVFDILLFENFGEKALKEYTDEDVISVYRKQSKYAKEKDIYILRDYAELKRAKKIIFTNKYKTQYVDFDGKIKTRYSSIDLFNGL